MPRTLNQHQRPGEVDIGAGLAQLLLDPLRGLRVGDVDRAAAPRMADRAVDQGMPRIPASRVFLPADSIRGIDSSSPRVYGCSAPLYSSSTGAVSTM